MKNTYVPEFDLGTAASCDVAEWYDETRETITNLLATQLPFRACGDADDSNDGKILSQYFQVSRLSDKSIDLFVSIITDAGWDLITDALDALGYNMDCPDDLYEYMSDKMDDIQNEYEMLESSPSDNVDDILTKLREMQEKMWKDIDANFMKVRKLVFDYMAECENE